MSPARDNSHVMKIKETEKFTKWIGKVRDAMAAAAITKRIHRIERDGYLGDARSVGAGVSELRIDVGQGYRVYFTVRGKELVILICGGNKTSQDRDIKIAQKMAKEL
jgi:putative addiction module killer protein